MREKEGILMGFIGDLTRTILITWVVFWFLSLIYFVIAGQIAIAVLFLVGLLIPLSFIVYEYWNYKKRE